jgi:hypothetical protein
MQWTIVCCVYVCMCVLWLQVVWTHPLWEATKQWTLLLYLAGRTEVLCSDSRQVGGGISCGRTDLLWLILLIIQWQRFLPGVTKLLSKTITTAYWKICSGWIKKLRIECFFHLFIYLLLPCRAARCNWNTWDCMVLQIVLFLFRNYIKIVSQHSHFISDNRAFVICTCAALGMVAVQCYMLYRQFGSWGLWLLQEPGPFYACTAKRDIRITNGFVFSENLKTESLLLKENQQARKVLCTICKSWFSM